MAGFVKVATVLEVPPGQGKLVTAGDKELALFNVGGTFYAIDNTCTHVGGPLSEGMLDDVQVECPWHGARFDVTTGKVLTPPAGGDVTSYKVRVNGSDIEIEL